MSERLWITNGKVYGLLYYISSAICLGGLWKRHE